MAASCFVYGIARVQNLAIKLTASIDFWSDVQVRGLQSHQVSGKRARAI